MIKNALTTLALIALIGMVGAMVVYPTITNTKAVAIRSGSMEPTIPARALAYVQQPQDTYEIGDIVTFGVGTDLYTHRIVGEWTGSGLGPYRTQGDANNAPDADLISRGAIVGRAVAYVPLLGQVQTILTTGPILYFIALVALSIILMPMIMRQPDADHAQPSVRTATPSDAGSPTSTDAPPLR